MKAIRTSRKAGTSTEPADGAWTPTRRVQSHAPQAHASSVAGRFEHDFSHVPVRATTPVLQMRHDSREGEPADLEKVHEAVSSAHAGATERLPFFDRIQESFGRHDLSLVHIHHDTRATAPPEITRPVGGNKKTNIGEGNHSTSNGLPSHRGVPGRFDGAVIGEMRLSEPGDLHEQEADRIADSVMQTPEPETQNPSLRGGGGRLTRPSTGQPLDTATRQFFEPRFGRNFSGVRIHVGHEAEQIADATGSRAFTLGTDIVFGRGQYAPDTNEGRHLLAHELAHTTQSASDTVQRKIVVGGKKTKAGQLLPAVTAGVSAWYTGVVAGLTSKTGGSFNSAKDMPFTEETAKKRAAQILREMQDAKSQQEVPSKKSGYAAVVGEFESQRRNYDFNFDSASDVTNEVLYRLALILYASLANNSNTQFGRFPTATDKGFDLRDTAAWSPVSTDTKFAPGGFQLNRGGGAAAAIEKVTLPKPLEQRIVADCATVAGLLHYQSLLNVFGAKTFDVHFGQMIVGNPTGSYNSGNTKHPLLSSVNSAKQPYLRVVRLSNLEDLVPGDTVSFVNYRDYRELAPSGLWNGEWAVFTRKDGKTLYFEGFGIGEMSYPSIINTMREKYINAWHSTDAHQKALHPLKDEESANDTIENKHPGISTQVFRPNLQAYTK